MNLNIVCSTVSDFDLGDYPEYQELPEEEERSSDYIRKVITKSQLTLDTGKIINFYMVVFYRNDIVSKILYYKDGKLHRDGDKPAYTLFYRNDPKRVKAEIYYEDGLKHRNPRKGPAEMIMRPNKRGKDIPRENYYIQGEVVPPL